MKEKNFIIIAISILFFIIAIIFLVYVMKMKEVNIEINSEVVYNQSNMMNSNKDHMDITIKAVILEVHSNDLTVMKISEKNELYNVNVGEKGNVGYKKGQEIIIYYDGTIVTTYPERISNVEKIEIIKEQTNTTIPDRYLEYYNNPTNSMKVSLLELEKTGISFLVYSENELLSDYSEDYEIYRSGSYNVNGIEGVSYIEKLEKKSDIPVEDTIMLTTDLEKKRDTDFIVKYDIDWTTIYGELETIDER